MLPGLAGRGNIWAGARGRSWNRVPQLQCLSDKVSGKWVHSLCKGDEVNELDASNAQAWAHGRPNISIFQAELIILHKRLCKAIFERSHLAWNLAICQARVAEKKKRGWEEWEGGDRLRWKMSLLHKHLLPHTSDSTLLFGITKVTTFP